MEKEEHQDKLGKAVSCCGFLNKKSILKLKTADSYNNRYEQRVQQDKSNTNYQFQQHNNSKSGTNTSSFIQAFNPCSKFDNFEEQQTGSNSNFTKEYTYSSTLKNTNKNSTFPGSFTTKQNYSRSSQSKPQISTIQTVNNQNKKPVRFINSQQKTNEHKIFEHLKKEARQLSKQKSKNVKTSSTDGEFMSSGVNDAYGTMELEDVKDLLTSGDLSELKQDTDYASMLDYNSSINKSDHQYKSNLSARGDFVSNDSSNTPPNFSQYSQYNNSQCNNHSFTNQSFSNQISRNREELSQDNLSQSDNAYISYVDYKSNVPNKLNIDTKKLGKDLPQAKFQSSNRSNTLSSYGQRSSKGDLRSSRGEQNSIKDISNKDRSSRKQISDFGSHQSSQRNSFTQYKSIQPMSFDSQNDRDTPNLLLDQGSDQDKQEQINSQLKDDNFNTTQDIKTVDSNDSCQLFENLIEESKFQSVNSQSSKQIESALKQDSLLRKSQTQSVSIDGGIRNNVSSGEALPISYGPDLSKVNWTSRSQSINKGLDNGFRYINTNSFDGTITQTQQSSASKNLRDLGNQRHGSVASRNQSSNFNYNNNILRSIANSTHSSILSAKLASSQQALQNTLNQNISTVVSMDRLSQTIDHDRIFMSKHDTLQQEQLHDKEQDYVNNNKGIGLGQVLELGFSGNQWGLANQQSKHTDKLSILLEEMYSTEQNSNKIKEQVEQEQEGELQNSVTRLSIYESRNKQENLMNQSLLDFFNKKDRKNVQGIKNDDQTTFDTIYNDVIQNNMAHGDHENQQNQDSAIKNYDFVYKNKFPDASNRSPLFNRKDRDLRGKYQAQNNLVDIDQQQLIQNIAGQKDIASALQLDDRFDQHMDNQERLFMTKKYQDLDQEKEWLTNEYKKLQGEYTRRLNEKQKQFSSSLNTIKQSKMFRQQDLLNQQQQLPFHFNSKNLSQMSKSLSIHQQDKINASQNLNVFQEQSSETTRSPNKIQHTPREQSIKQANGKKGNINVPFRSSVNVDVSKSPSRTPPQNTKSNLFRQDTPNKAKKLPIKYNSLSNTNNYSANYNNIRDTYQPKSMQEEMQILSHHLDQNKKSYNQSSLDRSYSKASRYQLGNNKINPMPFSSESLSNQQVKQKANKLKEQAQRIQMNAQNSVKSLLQQQGMLSQEDYLMFRKLLDSQLEKDVMQYQSNTKRRCNNDDDYIELPSFSQKLEFNSHTSLH